MIIFNKRALNKFIKHIIWGVFSFIKSNSGWNILLYLHTEPTG